MSPLRLRKRSTVKSREPMAPTDGSLRLAYGGGYLARSERKERCSLSLSLSLEGGVGAEGRDRTRHLTHLLTLRCGREMN